jgi:hypothetical protein
MVVGMLLILNVILLGEKTAMASKHWLQREALPMPMVIPLL